MVGIQAQEAKNVAGETPSTATGKSEQIRDAPLAVLVALPRNRRYDERVVITVRGFY
jgi:hypothetical protein